MIKQWFVGLSTPQRLLVFITISLILSAISKSAYYTFTNGGTDLRSRVVGARLLSTNQSPYFYTWQRGDSETLLDPNVNRSLLVNGVSVAPGVLFFHRAFSFLPYQIIRFAWLFFQYLLLLYIVISSLRNTATNARSKLQIFAVSGILFCAAPTWMYHIERGQIYILYAFFFFVLYQLLESKKSTAPFAAGLLLMAAVYCRPTFAVAIIPFMYKANKKRVAGMLTGIVFFGLHAAFHVQLWKDYFRAMFLYSHPYDLVQTNVSIPLPSTVEGMNNLTTYKGGFPGDGLLPLATILKQFSINLPDIVYLLLYSAAAISLLFFTRKTFFASPKGLVLTSFVLYITTEYFFPAPRSAYNLVQWIVPVLLLLQPAKAPKTQLIIIVTALCFVNNIPQYFPLMNGLGELMLLALVVLHLKRSSPPSPLNAS